VRCLAARLPADVAATLTWGSEWWVRGRIGWCLRQATWVTCAALVVACDRDQHPLKQKAQQALGKGEKMGLRAKAAPLWEGCCQTGGWSSKQAPALPTQTTDVCLDKAEIPPNWLH
jgi:hypothetical protein